MNIYTPPGSKVHFAYPENGYPYDRETARKHLTVGEIYTVSQVEIDKWVSYATLEECPGVKFNSVLFENDNA